MLDVHDVESFLARVPKRLTDPVIYFISTPSRAQRKGHGLYLPILIILIVLAASLVTFQGTYCTLTR